MTGGWATGLGFTDTSTRPPALGDALNRGCPPSGVGQPGSHAIWASLPAFLSPGSLRDQAGHWTRAAVYHTCFRERKAPRDVGEKNPLPHEGWMAVLFAQQCECA